MKNISSAYNHRLNIDRVAELGWNEIETTKYIKTSLKKKPLYEGFGKNKVGLVYRVGKGEKKILLRADIDALQTSKGVAHICGHSTHAGALICAFEWCVFHEQMLSEKNLSIYFIFQPAEETFPSGAAAVVEQMKKDRLQFDEIHSVHVRPLMSLGVIGLQSGTIWARGDYLEIECLGQQRHVKDSDKGQDAMCAASRMIAAVKEFHNTHIKDVRWGIGTIAGGRQANTVADSVTMTGDIRLRHDSLQSKVKSYLSDVVQKIQKETGCQIKYKYSDGYPSVENDQKTTAKLIQYLKKKDTFQLATENMFSFGCEDFGYYNSLGPICMAFIGTGDKHDIHEEDCVISKEGTENTQMYFMQIIKMWMQSEQ